MEQQYNYYAEQPAEKKGSIVSGIIGALAGALIGAAIWAAVGIFLDLITGLIGFLIGFLASKGYDLFKGRQGRVKLVCVILAVIIGVVVGTCAVYTWVLNESYNTQLAELTDLERRFYEVMTKEEFFKDNLTNNPEFMKEVYKNLGLSLLFAALGCLDLFKGMAAKPVHSVTFDDASPAPAKDTED